jgi:transposase, IS5 family
MIFTRRLRCRTEIHHPTDSGLLVDSVRVLSRFVKRIKGLVAEQVRSVEQPCRSRLRCAKRVAHQLHRQLHSFGEDKEAQQKELYQKLLETAGHMVRQATRVVAALSLFEAHTRAIPRNIRGALVEFGRHVILDEIEDGIVTRYQILEHPNEHGQAVETVAHHVALFDHPPGIVAGDRDVHFRRRRPRSPPQASSVAIPAYGKLSEERKVLEHPRPCGMDIGGAKAATTGKTGWSGGWVWE